MKKEQKSCLLLFGSGCREMTNALDAFNALYLKLPIIILLYRSVSN